MHIKETKINIFARYLKIKKENSPENDNQSHNAVKEFLINQVLPEDVD